jgi:hypothetical protein
MHTLIGLSHFMRVSYLYTNTTDLFAVSYDVVDECYSYSNQSAIRTLGDLDRSLKWLVPKSIGSKLLFSIESRQSDIRAEVVYSI